MAGEMSLAAISSVLLLATANPTQPDPACRDRFLEPFSSSSIWNTAVGSDAVFAPALLYQNEADFPTQFHNDQDFFLLATAADPLTPWIDQGDWGSDDHCQVTGQVVSQIPLPVNFTTASDGTGPGQPNNNAMGILLPDNETLVQMQPVYRCSAGGPLLARFGNDTDGCSSSLTAACL